MADVLSRPSANAVHISSDPAVLVEELALAQIDDLELAKLRTDSSLKFQDVPLALSDG